MSPTSDWRRSGLVLLRAATITLAYVSGSLVSHAVLVGADQVTMVWIPAGVALASLVLLGRRYWPVIFLADLLMQALPPPTALLFFPFSATANTLSALVAATVIQRLHREAMSGYSLRTGTATVIAAFVNALVSAPIGIVGLLVIGLPFAEVGNASTKWLSANVFGVLLVTPALILGWHAAFDRQARMPTQARVREGSIWLLLYLGSGLLLTTVNVASTYMLGLLGLPLALLIWASLRFPPLLAASASLVTGITTVLACGRGLGGFDVPASHGDAIVLMLFLATIALMPLFLSAANHERKLADESLRQANDSLERRVAERTAELSSMNQALTGAMHELQATQQQLVEREKMASLGGLVAGLAHEVNTPVGVALTSATFMDQRALDMAALLESGQLSRRKLDEFVAELRQGMQLLTRNLQRTGDLVSSFKQLAVDQTSEQRRVINVAAFIDEVMLALGPMYKRRCQFECECAEHLAIDTYPGPLFQVLTNLISNAVTHAFGERSDGLVRIRVRADADEGIVMTFADDGVGMTADVAERAFEPFFTTRRGQGGSGLGLHLVYNLVSQALGGRIELATQPAAGCCFTIWLPSTSPVPRAAQATGRGTSQAPSTSQPSHPQFG